MLTTRRKASTSPSTRNSASRILSLNCSPPAGRDFLQSLPQVDGLDMQGLPPGVGPGKRQQFFDEGSGALGFEQNVSQSLAVFFFAPRSSQGQFRLGANQRDRSS